MQYVPFLKKLTPSLKSYIDAYNDGSADYNVSEFAKLVMAYDDCPLCRIWDKPSNTEMIFGPESVLRDEKLSRKMLSEVELSIREKYPNAEILILTQMEEGHVYKIRRSKVKMFLKSITRKLLKSR